MHQSDFRQWMFVCDSEKICLSYRSAQLRIEVVSVFIDKRGEAQLRSVDIYDFDQQCRYHLEVGHRFFWEVTPYYREEGDPIVFQRGPTIAERKQILRRCELAAKTDREPFPFYVRVQWRKMLRVVAPKAPHH